MARSISEIKKTMTDAFLADEDLREAYGIEEGATWSDVFSNVSVENILLYVVAACIYVHECAWDLFSEEVNEKIAANVVPTKRWYYTRSLEFQYGDELVYNEEKEKFEYAETDESKRLVKYCAIKDAGGSVKVLVAGQSGGSPAVLEDNVLNAFKSYLNQIKIAGIILDIKSLEADKIRIVMTVNVNPQIIDITGKRISDGSSVVVDAVNAYLAGIAYGGTFNKTKLVDAVQVVTGVTDVTLGKVTVKSVNDSDFVEVASNNYTAVSGCFVSENLNTTINYVI